MHEVRTRGYTDSYSILREYLATIRPAAERDFEIRFETSPSEQSQVDFSCSRVCDSAKRRNSFT